MFSLLTKIKWDTIAGWPSKINMILNTAAWLEAGVIATIPPCFLDNSTHLFTSYFPSAIYFQTVKHGHLAVSNSNNADEAFFSFVAMTITSDL